MVRAPRPVRPDDYVSRAEFEALQWDLERKVQEIEEVREQNTRLALDAAWGLVPAVRSLPVWGLAFLILATVDWPWWANLLVIFAATGASGYITVQANEQRMKEVDSLHKIDPWRSS